MDNLLLFYKPRTGENKSFKDFWFLKMTITYCSFFSGM